MAYYKLNAYDANVAVGAFAGLMQYGDGMNGDVRFAVDEENMETPAGVLQPQASPEVLSFGFEGKKIETLAHLYRRWYSGLDDKNVLIAAVDGKLYYHLATGTGAWTQLAFPSGVTSYACNVWSWVAYEYNYVPEYDSTATYALDDIVVYEGETYKCTTAISTPEAWTAAHWTLTVVDPVDVMLLSNAKDGMVMVRGDDFSVTAIDTHKKFGVIERYAERIWGGAIDDDPDMLMYSAPFDPTDWEAQTEIPEDGAGDISQPSWDGNSFTALKSFGSQLIAFKQNRVWRILGTDPGEYTFKEQFGGGAPYAYTIAVDAERIFMVENDGLSIYDGLSVNPYQRNTTEILWRNINKAAMDQVCGALFKDRYYLAYPVGTSTINNEMLILNLRDGTMLRYTDINIESFLATDEILYATSSTIPGKVLKLNWDSWKIGSASGAATKWVTPWMDFNAKRIQKGGFDLYFTPEVQSDPVTLIFSVQTEKKTKTKKYTVQPLAAGKEYRQKRLHFGGAGRRFRVIIETAAGNTAPWRLIGGIQLIVETDPD